MKIKTWMWLLVMGLAAQAAHAASATQYSADMVMTSDGQTVAGKIYVSEGKMRYEMPQAITITRIDRGISYVLMPSEKMYMEHPIDRLAGVKAGLAEGDVQRETLGQESLDGREVEKAKVTYTDKQGTTTYLQWTDAQGLPAKVAAEDGSWTVEYKNASLGAQEDSLFEVPSDYQGMAIPNMASVQEMMKQAASAEAQE